MPLVRVEVRNEYGLGGAEMYRPAEVNKEDSKDIFEGISAAGLVGVLRQLGDLVDFAAEVFHGLQEEVTITSSPSHKLMSRVQLIEAALSPLEKAVLAQRSHLHLAYTAGSSWHAPIRCEENHFLHSDLPHFILDSYEDCRVPPRLHLLDKFDPGGLGSCLKRYTDPSFFKRASVVTGEASIENYLEDEKGQNVKKRRSWPSNGEVSWGASFSNQSGRMQFTRFNVGGYSSPSQPISNYDATPRSDLSEQSTLGLRNGSGYSKGDFKLSYSMHQKEQESRDFITSPVKKPESDYLDYDFLGEKVTNPCDDIQINITQEQGGCSSYNVTSYEKTDRPEPIMEVYDHSGMTREDDQDRNMESLPPNSYLEIRGDNDFNFENVEKMAAQTCDQALPTFESGNIHLDNFESQIDHFMDALNTVEPESETDIDCTRRQYIDHFSKLEDQTADGGPSEPLKYKSECQTSNSYSNALANGSLMDGGCQAHNPISVSLKFPESEKHSPEASNVTSASIWTNGGLLGLQPSKPPDCSVLNDHIATKDGIIVSSSQHQILNDKDRINGTESSNNIEEGLDIYSSSTCDQECHESGISFRKPCWKISLADLEVKLGKQGHLLHLENANSSNQNTNAYEQKNDQNFARRTFSGKIKDLSGGECLTLSPSSSPPLVHMQISFQPVDRIVTSKLKLKFLDGNTNDQSGEDFFPSFQLVPEKSFSQHTVGSDSEDDTFDRTSPSVSDDCQSYQSESNSEPELYDSLRGVSLTESFSTDIHEDSGFQFPFVEQNSQSCRSFDLHSLAALNHSFGENQPEFETTCDPPPLPPIQWWYTTPHLDDTQDKCDEISKCSNYAVDFKHSSSTISQQPKPAPLTDDQNMYITNGPKSKKFGSQNSNGRREANQSNKINEKEDFLHQIRSKSFNLRRTVPAKTNVLLSRGPSNIQVTAILERANSIRRAVGSDDGDEDGDWSDT